LAGELDHPVEEDRERVLAIEKLRAIIEEGVSKKCLMSQFELEAEELKRE